MQVDRVCKGFVLIVNKILGRILESQDHLARCYPRNFW